MSWNDIVRPRRPDPPGVLPQRGFIHERHARHLQLVLNTARTVGTKVLGLEDPLDSSIEPTPERLEKAEAAVRALAQAGPRVTGDFTPDTLVDAVRSELFGLGPLDRFLSHPDITEVMVNGPYVIFVEREGRIVETGHKFLDDAHVERILRRILRPLGRSIGPEDPLVDARLPDGSRVNAAVAPCAIDGPSLTIRRFPQSRLALSDLVDRGALSAEMARFLSAIVQARQNVVVSGGTGSGKTTLINALSQFIPDGERVVTIEDAAELRLVQRNVVRLETKKATRHDPVAVTIRDCVANALRMRPERILVGECRSAEALDMLQAMNTGHDGSMTTVHANNPRASISRLETLSLMGGLDLPVHVIRKQIASAVNFVVQAARLRDGSRRVTHVTEVLGMEGEVVTLSDIFVWRDDLTRHVATGTRPRCTELLAQHGLTFPPSFFLSR